MATYGKPLERRASCTVLPQNFDTLSIRLLQDDAAPTPFRRRQALKRRQTSSMNPIKDESPISPEQPPTKRHRRSSARPMRQDSPTVLIPPSGYNEEQMALFEGIPFVGELIELSKDERVARFITLMKELMKILQDGYGEAELKKQQKIERISTTKQMDFRDLAAQINKLRGGIREFIDRYCYQDVRSWSSSRFQRELEDRKQRRREEFLAVWEEARRTVVVRSYA